MRLELLLPFEVLVREPAVVRIVAETASGSLGLLPHRRDCVAVLVPGLFCYQTPEHGEVFLAVDEGTLVKTGDLVRVSARRALGGSSLARLHEVVNQQFLAQDARELELRSTLATLESGLLRSLAQFQDG